jgi:hypothetical protein
MVNESSDNLNLTFSSAYPGYDEPLYIIDDYGPIGGDGMMNARHVLAANGSEYVIKGPTTSPGYKYVGANELICAKLAKGLGLPVLEHDLLQDDNKLFFGSLHMRTSDFYQELTPGLFARCINAQVVYLMVAFDTWVCNNDRHEENLIARRLSTGPGVERLLLICNDHSNALLHTVRPSGLKMFDMSMAEAVLVPFVRDFLTDAGLFRAELNKVIQYPRSLIKSAVQAVPTQWLGPREKSQVEDFLISRQGRLLSNVRASLACLPRMSPDQL